MLFVFHFQCYRDLEQVDKAAKFCNLAVLLPCVTKEVSPSSANECCYFISTVPTSSMNIWSFLLKHFDLDLMCTVKLF